jgi:Pyruvate kinase, barrel domain
MKVRCCVLSILALSPVISSFVVQTPQSSRNALPILSMTATLNGVPGTGWAPTAIPEQQRISTPTYASQEQLLAAATSQRWRKCTKQVVTLGPASSSMEMIEKLFLAGADMFRLNFSHGSQEQKLDLLRMIRAVEEKYSHPIAIMGDLQGPKLRVRYISYQIFLVCSSFSP